jgi:2-(1,2-epoxy-1,2-dihydrophenyl)acetyl-CoA isomerase
MSDSVLLESQEGVLVVTLNRPKANAFNYEMIEAVQVAFKQAARDPLVRCVLLTGSGAVFSAGQDVKEFTQAEDLSFRYHLQRTYNPLILQIRRLEKPVVAAINGAVAGAALGLALACDLRIAAAGARFVVGFLGIGLAPDSAAQQALAWGLVNRVVPSEELPAAALAWAAQLARGPVHTMGLTKRDFNKAVLPNLEEVLDYEAHIQEVAGRAAEHKEGVQAFLGKRAPLYPPLK